MREKAAGDVAKKETANRHHPWRAGDDVVRIFVQGGFADEFDVVSGHDYKPIARPGGYRPDGHVDTAAVSGMEAGG